MVKKKIITMALCAAMAANVCMPVSAAELPADTAIVTETATDTTEETSEEAVAEGETTEETSKEAVTEAETTEAVETTTVEEVVTEESETVAEDATQTDAGLAEDTEEVNAASDFEWNGTEIVGYKGTGGAVTIPNNCTAISGDAFSGTSITTITIPDSVKSIGNGAFYNCISLRSATLGNGISYIPRYLFQYCKSLRTVTLNCKKATSIGMYAFAGCSSLQSITIPDSVESIYFRAFEECKSLKTVNLGNGVTEIDGYCFYNCTSLSNVTWSKNLKTISYYAFYNNALTTLNLPSGLTSIGYYAFACNCLKSVKLPESVVGLGYDVFAINEQLTYAQIGNKITTIPDSCFAYCSSLKTVVLGNAVQTIGSYAFQKCTSLENVNIPDSVVKINDNAFEKCKSLSTLVIGNGVVEIQGDAFEDCESLKKLYLPYGLVTVGSGFYGFAYGASDLTLYVYKGTYAEEWANNTRWNVVTREFVPNPVSGLKAAPAGKNRVYLTWSESAFADGYIIYAKRNNAKTTYIGMTSKTSYTDTKALDTAYNYYFVYPYVTNANGKRVLGKCPKYVYAKGVCKAVTNLKATSVKGGVKITWTKSAGADGYLIYGKRGSNDKYGYIGLKTSNGATSFTDTKALKSSYNFYWVFPYHFDKNGKRVVGPICGYVYGKAK